MFEMLYDKVINTEIEHQRMQSAYFLAREKKGPVPALKVYQPKREPGEGDLVAIFVEPGAAHLVFRDEIAPEEDLDTKYRETRLQVFGRTHDVESVEIVDDKVKFVNNSSLVDIYETSFHWTNTEDFKGFIFSDTWNHMLSSAGKWVNVFRGGYRLVEVPVLEGDRAAAEKWTPEKPSEEG